MSLEQEFETIRSVPIFSTIDPAMQKLLAFSSERLAYAPGQVMFSAGDAPEYAYIVMEGEVDISVPTPRGPLVVNTLRKNDVIGEIGIFGDVPRTATATARTALEVLRISRDTFVNVIRSNPDAAIALIRILADRLAKTTAQLRRLAAEGR
ncbi:MAG: Crp/Fnr family transcriptional regulator [Burkholderiales bacterium]|nr:Crp/Fnr family transcriptional regulator [Burkholderiales bacterium]